MKVMIFIVFILINTVHSTTYKCNSTAKCGCSKESTVDVSKIVGGELAPSHAWDWSISLQQNNRHICGASLITPEYAITAAHCLYSIYDISSLSIVFGDNYLYSGNVQRRKITRMAIHPNYQDFVKANDIAILKFSPLNTSSNTNISFICLPEKDKDPFQTNSSLVAIGWGVTTHGDSAASSSLRQVTLKAVSLNSSNCQQSGLSDSKIQFCAGVPEGGKDTCQGDSGGPLMAFLDNRWVLAGVTSFGRGCGEVGYPGVYTRVSSYINWINDPSATTETSTTVPGSFGRSLYHSITMMIFSLILVAYSCFSY